MFEFMKKSKRKYELVPPDDENLSIIINGREIKGWQQIVAVRSFGSVREGDLGPYVLYSNISNEGLAWAAKSTFLLDTLVEGNAYIGPNSIISRVLVKDHAKITHSNLYAPYKYKGSELIVQDSAEIDRCDHIEVVGHSSIIGGNTKIISAGEIRLDGVTLKGDTYISHFNASKK